MINILLLSERIDQLNDPFYDAIQANIETRLFTKVFSEIADAINERYDETCQAFPD